MSLLNPVSSFSVTQTNKEVFQQSYIQVFFTVNLYHHQYFLNQSEFFQPKLYLHLILSKNLNLILYSVKSKFEWSHMMILRRYKFVNWALALQQNWSGLESLLGHQMVRVVSTLSSLSLSLHIYEIYIINGKAVCVKHLVCCLIYNRHSTNGSYCFYNSIFTTYFCYCYMYTFLLLQYTFVIILLLLLIWRV